MPISVRILIFTFCFIVGLAEFSCRQNYGIAYGPLTPDEKMVSIVPSGQCVSIWLNKHCRAAKVMDLTSDKAARQEAIKEGTRVVQLIYIGMDKITSRKPPIWSLLFWQCSPQIEELVLEHNTANGNAQELCSMLWKLEDKEG